MSRILVVDDEEAIRSMLSDVLSANGYECEGVGTAVEALEKISGASYDLVILDQNLPIMTGAQALTRLRANPKYKDLPVLFCTSTPIGPEAVKMGANGFISKPVGLQMLLDAVSSFVKPGPRP